jgi:predicted O-methyltransferase YrrM
VRNEWRPGLTLEEYAERWVDMAPHLETLTMLAGRAKVAVEFGVRGGVSTWALLNGLPADGQLISYDIDECCRETCPPQLFEDPRWEFVIGDSLTADLPSRADLVMIDSSHEYDSTCVELQRAAGLTPSVIVLHDYYDPPHPGVRRAVDEFVADSAYRIERVEDSQWGLAILVPG